MVQIRRFAQNGALLYRCADGTEYLIDPSRRHVFASWPKGVAEEDVIHYLFGPVLGVILHARGTPCLHSSVVVVEDRAVGLIGPAGVGKSTAAASFARLGYPVLSDDLMVLDERDGCLRVQPGPTVLRLRSASVEALYGSRGALPRLAPALGRYYLDLNGQGAFCDEAKPLGAIYLLRDRRRGSGHPSVEAIPPRDALLGLVGHSYAAKLPGPLERKRKFELLGRVASSIPIRRLIPGDEWEGEESLPSVVLEDLHRHRQMDEALP